MRGSGRGVSSTFAERGSLGFITVSCTSMLAGPNVRFCVRCRAVVPSLYHTGSPTSTLYSSLVPQGCGSRSRECQVRGVVSTQWLSREKQRRWRAGTCATRPSKECVPIWTLRKCSNRLLAMGRAQMCVLRDIVLWDGRRRGYSMRRPPPSQRAMSLGRVHGGVWPARPCPKRERGATTMERLWTALQPIAQRLTNVPKE